MKSTVYEIRLQGWLDLSRAQWCGGMALSHDGQGNTILRGPVVDQAALYGLLDKARDLGLPLLSVNRVVAPTRKNDPYDAKCECFTTLATSGRHHRLDPGSPR
jgi:hypothetical protein